jgi:hypothetical protein
LGDVVYTHLYAYVDPTKTDDLENAFTFQAVVRAGGADVFDSGQVALKNGPISAPPVVPGGAALGTVQGEIDDWNFVSGSWATTTAVRFLVSAKADVTVPLAVIARLVPGVGPLLGIAAGLFGKVRVTVGHENVLIPIVRDGTRKVVTINNVPIP